MATRGKSTAYKVKNPEKYVGNVDSIVCRSSWERFVCRHLDGNTNVRRWASEEVVIPYKSPLDAQPHRYFVDFFVELNDGTRFLVEVKPFVQTQPPQMNESGRKTKRYAEDCRTYSVNLAKWDAAKRWCDRNGMRFQIWTENELRMIGHTTF